MSWVRNDGQSIRANAVYQADFDNDKQICLGEAQRANVSGVTFAGGGLAGAVAAAERGNAVADVGKGCMAAKGYTLVPEEEAEAKRAQLAAVAEQRKQMEAAALRPPTGSMARR